MNVGTTVKPQPNTTGERVLANAIEYQRQVLTADFSDSVSKISSRIDGLFELLARIHTDAKIPEPDYPPLRSEATATGTGFYVDVIGVNTQLEALIQLLNDQVARFDSALTTLQQYI